jgi:hypothetical protein
MATLGSYKRRVQASRYFINKACSSLALSRQVSEEWRQALQSAATLTTLRVFTLFSAATTPLFVQDQPAPTGYVYVFGCTVSNVSFFIHLYTDTCNTSIRHQSFGFYHHQLLR